MKEYIEVGDIVNIHFETIASEFEVTILCIPLCIDAHEDTWRLRRKDGTLIYVKTFTLMEIAKQEAER